MFILWYSCHEGAYFLKSVYALFFKRPVRPITIPLFAIGFFRPIFVAVLSVRSLDFNLFINFQVSSLSEVIQTCFSGVFPKRFMSYVKIAVCKISNRFRFNWSPYIGSKTKFCNFQRYQLSISVELINAGVCCNVFGVFESFAFEKSGKLTYWCFWGLLGCFSSISLIILFSKNKRCRNSYFDYISKATWFFLVVFKGFISGCFSPYFACPACSHIFVDITISDALVSSHHRHLSSTLLIAFNNTFSDIWKIQWKTYNRMHFQHFDRLLSRSWQTS